MTVNNTTIIDLGLEPNHKHYQIRIKNIIPKPSSFVQPIIYGISSFKISSNYCFVIGQMSEKREMLQRRYNASSVIFKNRTVAWIVGGTDHGSLNSTEFIRLNMASREGPKLPFTIYAHCMVLYKENAIYIIGGCQNGTFSKKTWIVDPTNGFQIRQGPSLNIPRASASCGKMEINGKIVLVVAGGQGSDYLDSVELLEPLSDQGWKIVINNLNNFFSSQNDYLNFNT